jgi:hypothetical protein
MTAMQKRVLVGAAAALTVAASVLPGTAAGAPKSPYTLSCVIGSTTHVEWEHQKVVTVTIDWTAPAGSGVTFDPFVGQVPSLHPPRGFWTVGTPSSGGVGPVSATATFRHPDGSSDQTTAACS